MLTLLSLFFLRLYCSIKGTYQFVTSAKGLSCFLQVPFLFGVPAFEKVASCVIHLIFRRTGRHLFLTDADEGNPPLLKRMLEDHDNCYFMYVVFFFLPSF